MCHTSRVTIQKHISRNEDVWLSYEKTLPPCPSPLPLDGFVPRPQRLHDLLIRQAYSQVRAPTLCSRHPHSRSVCFSAQPQHDGNVKSRVRSFPQYSRYDVFLYLFNASGLMINNHHTPQPGLHRPQLTPVLGSSTDVSRECSGPSMLRPPIAMMRGSPCPGYIILFPFFYLTPIYY